MYTSFQLNKSFLLWPELYESPWQSPCQIKLLIKYELFGVVTSIAPPSFTKLVLLRVKWMLCSFFCIDLPHQNQTTARKILENLESATEDTSVAVQHV